jgi:hypothetical protein
VHSAIVEKAGEWMIFPGEAPNLLLELLHANEWFVKQNSRALARPKLQGSVKRID